MPDIADGDQQWLRQALASVAAADEAAVASAPPPPTLDALLASVRAQARTEMQAETELSAERETRTRSGAPTESVAGVAPQLHPAPQPHPAPQSHPDAQPHPATQPHPAMQPHPDTRPLPPRPDELAARRHAGAPGPDQLRRRRWNRIGQWGMAAAGVVLLAVVVGTMIRSAAPTATDTADRGASVANGAMATTTGNADAAAEAAADAAAEATAGAAGAASAGTAPPAAKAPAAEAAPSGAARDQAGAPAPTRGPSSTPTAGAQGGAGQQAASSPADAPAPAAGSAAAGASGAAGGVAGDQTTGAAATSTSGPAETCSWRALPTTIDGAADASFGKGVVSGSRPLTAPCQAGQIGGAVLPAADGSRAAVVVQVLRGEPDCSAQGCRPAGENRYAAPAGSDDQLRAWVNTPTSQVVVSAPPSLGLSSDQLLAFAEAVGDQVG